MYVVYGTIYVPIHNVPTKLLHIFSKCGTTFFNWGRSYRTMALSDSDIASSLSEPDPCTRKFIFQQTMFRVKDPKASLDFYTRVMGMRFVDPTGFLIYSTCCLFIISLNGYRTNNHC